MNFPWVTQNLWMSVMTVAVEDGIDKLNHVLKNHLSIEQSYW